ncbi:MAG: phosphoribosylformimino-5-aminoimidazole carboxamide ribotide isomerase [Lachnospiraceae bacterium]|nr:phosphoribosylformimino-5-aminoimidazole carboxamide ribotide isomerase [Lachnospiraceae bacterium]
MRFRPCIDIHNGKVKQIVGVSLEESTDRAQENFVSEHDAAWFARFYAQDDLTGGHIIILNRGSSPEYMPSRDAALAALKAAPGMFQMGGGITPYNADEFLDAGASKVIVTSYVFQDGCFNERHLNKMTAAVGRDRLVLDLSCRKSGDSYYIVTDHWTKFTDVELTHETLEELAGSCSEFLIHAVDAEGLRRGPELALVDILAKAPIPATYAGGVADFKDLEDLRERGMGRVDVTIGSALDIFGGSMPYREVLDRLKPQNS